MKKEVYGVIYLLICAVNDKEYVGQTTRSGEQRFKEHAESPYYIGKAIRAHGEDMFVIVTLKECYSKEELDYWEKHFIKYRDTMVPNGYNLMEGGSNGSPCEETVEKIRASVIAYNEAHPEIHDKISEANIQRFSDPEERAKQAERTRKSFEDPERAAKHSEGQKRRFERQEERDKISAAVTERFSDPAEREAQSVRIKEAFKKPGVTEKISERQKKRFEDPEEHKKVSIGVLKYFAEHGGRKHTDETKEKIRVKRTAYCARVRAEKKRAAVGEENRAAAQLETSLADLKEFLATNPIKPHSTDEKKERRAAKRLAKVAEQNQKAARLPSKLVLKNPS